MGRKSAKENPDDTLHRLLQAATEVFAEVGYEAATIRTICARASANVALINYHFGDKFELYSEVLRQCARKRPVDAVRAALDSGKLPEEILRDLIRIRLHSAFEGDESGYDLRLLCHELAKPTPAMTQHLKTLVLPTFHRVLEVIGAILRLPPDHEETRMCARSVMGQVLLYVITRPLATQVWAEKYNEKGFVDRVADHIADFSLAYMRESRRRRAEPQGDQRMEEVQ